MPSAVPASVPRPALPTLPPVSLPAFEGPLDLLLHLVRQGRMDIFDLPMATLCEQYLGYLAALQTRDLNLAGEFLVMAATLLEIKSRMLLPPVPRDDVAEPDNPDSIQDPRAELVERLLEYGKYQTIAETLRSAEADRRSVFFRGPTPYTGAFRVPPCFGELSASDLLKALERMLANVGVGEQSITSVRRQKITLRLAMRQVMGQVEKAAPDGVRLEDLLPAPPFALLEVVLLFLALLELLKQGNLQVMQDSFCGDIYAFLVPEADRASLVGVDEAAA